MLKQNTTLITQLLISPQSRPEADMVVFLNMKTNENPLLYRIVVSLEWETSQIYNNTGLYQSSNNPRLHRKASFTYVFDMADIIHMVRPEYISLKCCSFPRESTDVGLYSGACRCNLEHRPILHKNLKSLTQKRRGT